MCVFFFYKIWDKLDKIKRIMLNKDMIFLVKVYVNICFGFILLLLII